VFFEPPQKQALHPDSLITILRQCFDAAGLADSGDYSSHSLRRGFATWANANQWDVKSLMEYVGWKMRSLQCAISNRLIPLPDTALS